MCRFFCSTGQYALNKKVTLAPYTDIDNKK